MLKIFEKRYFPALSILAVSTVISGLMIAFRVVHTSYVTYLFLIWNLFLAWIPVVFAWYASQTKGKLAMTMAFIAWLLFFPNTHYILTDLFHLRMRNDVPLWYDLLLLLTASWTGAMLGFLSLLEIHRWMRKWLSNSLTWLAVLMLFSLESLGIYIGRYERLNSWDILTNPFQLLHFLADIFFNPLRHQPVFHFVMGFTVFLFISYLFLYVLIKPRFNENTKLGY